jgi:hypothetical protein
VLATGVEFAGDVFASSVVLFGTIAAARPADANHPYGHGRAETLAAIVVGLGLVAGGAGISWRSLRGVGDLHAPPTSLATIVIGISILIRGGMAILKFRVGRRVGSSALVADAWNDTVDILAGVAALTAVGLAMYDPRRFLTADHYGAFAVGLLVILTGVRVFRDASLDLMDTMPGQDSHRHHPERRPRGRRRTRRREGPRAQDRIPLSRRSPRRSRRVAHGRRRARHWWGSAEPAPRGSSVGCRRARARRAGAVLRRYRRGIVIVCTTFPSVAVTTTLISVAVASTRAT